MLDVILDTIIDSLKLLPFLILVFIFMEYFEHKFSEKSRELIYKSGRFGPIIGGILGAFPQCGFSVAITNLYATKIVSMGTLIAIYLSTTDEMIPILISRGVGASEIIKLVLIQVVVAIIFGLLIDVIFKRKTDKEAIGEFCSIEHCHCHDKGVIKSGIKHALNIFMYIFIVTFILNSLFFFVGEDFLANLFMKDSIFSPIIAGLIGLIPNCVSSVILTELYINNVISLGSVISGLLTASGVAFLVLFRVNKNVKENIKIVFITFLIGVLSGLIVDLIF